MSGNIQCNPMGIVGLIVNYVYVISHIGMIGRYRFYLCKCICGKQFRVIRQSLVGKRPIQSCGCKHPQRLAWGDTERTHGLSGTNIYNRWKRMIGRCHKPLDPKYKHYGARGIAVCERWHKFENFFADMGMPPSPGHSLDRIDVNGNYEPVNVRWATQKTQQNNRNNTRWIAHGGRTMRLTEWAESVGINPRLLRQRLDRDKLSMDKALKRPEQYEIVIPKSSTTEMEK